MKSDSTKVFKVQTEIDASTDQNEFAVIKEK